MRQHNIEINWRVKGIRTPKVLKGHDDHVITCLQFSNNRIVSGSDDNTLKVWHRRPINLKFFYFESTCFFLFLGLACRHGQVLENLGRTYGWCLVIANAR
jgi:WD40 repeat protein